MTDKPEPAVAAESCDHFYSWISPAGTSHGAQICIRCRQPDPVWLNEIYGASPTVPRVAESLDDLREGQVVAVDAHGLWKVGTVRNVGNGGAMLQLQGDDVRSQSAYGFTIGAWVILSDPPPEPVTVSRERVEALAEAITAFDGPYHSFERRTADVVTAARALVDEVRGNQNGHSNDHR